MDKRVFERATYHALVFMISIAIGICICGLWLEVDKAAIYIYPIVSSIGAHVGFCLGYVFKNLYRKSVLRVFVLIALEVIFSCITTVLYDDIYSGFNIGFFTGFAFYLSVPFGRRLYEKYNAEENEDIEPDKKDDYE